MRVLSTYLKPYKNLLTAVVVLQLLGTIASLYLPSLNADIIDHGIARGDTDYILRTGFWMLLVSGLQIAGSIVATYFGAKAACCSAATCVGRSSTGSAASPGGR
jgi:ATP-binding cassette subfamily B protein